MGNVIRMWIRREEKKDFESLFLSYLKLIEGVSRSVARGHGYGQEEAEDFRAHVITRFIQDDYAILRKFQGRSSLSLYLKTVIHRLYIDYEIALKGKWRSSTVARRIGPVAVQLEELLHRKHHTFEEAFQILQSRGGGNINREELHEIVQKLPKRWGKTTVQFVPLNSDEPPETLSVSGLSNPNRINDARRLSQVVKEYIGRLSGADRLMLKMRFQDDFTFEEIGRLVKKKKLQVYARVQKILGDLQDVLLSHDLNAADVREILELAEKRIDVDFVVPDETEQK